MKRNSFTSWWLGVASLLVALSLVTPAGAITATVGAAQDNTLYENLEGGLSNGAGQHFFAGRTGQQGGGMILRGLIRFDVAGHVPPGSIVNRVQLRLNASSPKARSGMIALHPVQSPWGEGMSMAPNGEGKGGPPTAGDATWIHTHFDQAFWVNPGGDFDQEASASLVVSGNGPQMIEGTLAMVTDVQGWLDNPESNYGWLIRQADEANAQAIRFDSRHHNEPGVRPSLIIEYSLPAVLISPPSGVLALTQVFDIVVFRNLPPGRTVTSVANFSNGANVTDLYITCFSNGAGSTPEGGQTFRCPSQRAADFGVGTHAFQTVFTLDDGTTIQDTVNWTIVENREP